MVDKLARIARYLNSLIIKSFGFSWNQDYNYKLPEITNKTELRELLIKDFFGSQPSVFKLSVFKTYIFVRRLSFALLRRLFGYIVKPLKRGVYD